MMTIEKKSLTKISKYADTKRVDSLIRNYKRDRWAENSKRIGKEDTLSQWYSIEELEQFIAKSKAHGANGVRLYFGELPEGDAKFPEMANQQVIVLVATKSKELGAMDSKDVYINTDSGSTILAYDPNYPCPTYCSGRTGGLTGDSDDWGGIGTTLVDRGEDGMVIV